LGALIGWLPAGHGEAEFRALRRLQLLAGRQRAPVFVLREARAAKAPSPAALRLRLAARDGRIEIALLKRRGRPLLAPIALQVHPPHWNDAHLPGSTAPAEPAIRDSLQPIFSH
jgi:hypothetical protein